MTLRTSALWAAAALLIVAGGCGPRALDPAGAPATGGSSNPDDVAAAIRAVAGPGALMIVGVNAGAVTRTPHGAAAVFEGDPDTLARAAMAVGMSICSVEFQKLVTPAVQGDPDAITIDDARAICDGDSLSDMVARLGSLKTASTAVIVAINTAITVYSTNHGINYFYDGDIIRLLRAARQLYVPVCVIAPDALSVATYPEGSSPGVTIEEALARCAL
jgi:hypothetical protein